MIISMHIAAYISDTGTVITLSEEMNEPVHDRVGERTDHCLTLWEIGKLSETHDSILTLVIHVVEYQCFSSCHNFPITPITAPSLIV